MGIRHLTNLEIRRLTGQTRIEDQIKSLDFQRLPYTVRRGVGGMILGLNLYDCHIRPLLTPFEWEIISDEHVGTGFRLMALDRKKAA